MRTSAGFSHSLVVAIASQQEWTSRSLESVLASRGYRVRKAFTRADVLALIRRKHPDAVIVDDLPDTDAATLCRELRDHCWVTPSTPVLLTLPSPATRRDRLAAWRAGAWACLGAPLDAEELFAVLEALLPAKRYADQARVEGLVDEQTGVYNASGLTRRARELASLASRHHAALGCVLIAPDLAETTKGHSEEILRRIADALKETARNSDAIGRMGSTAFVVLAVDTDAPQARRLGERLADAVLAMLATAGPTSLPPLKLFGGFHGVSDFRAAEIDPAELMVRATAALNHARAQPSGSWLRGFEDGS